MAVVVVLVVVALVVAATAVDVVVLVDVVVFVADVAVVLLFDTLFADAFLAFCCALTALGLTLVVGGGGAAVDASMPPFSKHSRQAFISNG